MAEPGSVPANRSRGGSLLGVGRSAADRYAALFSPVIERLTFAVVQRAMSRGADLPDRYQTTADAIRMFGQLRTTLAGRAVSRAALAAVYRYHPPEDLGRNLATLATTGLVIIADDGAIRATEKGHRLLDEMYDTGADITATLWADQFDTLPGINTLAGRLVTAGLTTGGTAFATMAPPHEPADAPVGLLVHHRLEVLRYHRADAHAAAWQAAGLTAAEIQQMPAGSARATIEAETNRRAGAPFAALTPEERLEFLAALAALPG